MSYNNQESSVVSRRKSSTVRVQTARLLVLGDRQVGKSASIVKYITGRFIQEYSSANDWLYKHSLAFDQGKGSTTSVELLEQKDIQFSSSHNFFATSANLLEQQQSLQSRRLETPQTLASRVALDQQIDNELHEKQNMFTKLRWANAYIVIYAIDDINTFNKAIKYLNLIANNINSPLDNQQQEAGAGSGGSSSSCSSAGSGNCSSNISPIIPVGSKGATTANRLTPTNHEHFHSSAASNFPSICLTGSGCSPANCHCSTAALAANHYRRPILLLGNKADLEATGRQVAIKDARRLAMRHQTMFAEVSIANSRQKPIESIFNNLIDNIKPTCLHAENLISISIPGNDSQLARNNRSQISKWNPRNYQRSESISISPLLASIVRSQPVVLGSFGVAKSASSKLSAGSKHEQQAQHQENALLVAPLISLAQSVETKSLKKPMVAYGMRELEVDRQSRYENLKSSFKKAFVGGKTLSRSSRKSTEVECLRGSTATSTAPKRAPVKGNSSFDSCDTSASVEVSRLPAPAKGHTSWYKRLGREQIARESAAGPEEFRRADSSSLSSEGAANKHRRPLFRYKSRRSTMGLEEMWKQMGGASLREADSTRGSRTDSTGSISNQNSFPPADIQGEPERSAAKGGPEERAPSSVGSWSNSSSGGANSPSFFNHSSSLATNSGNSSRRPASQSTLSRTSTSGGSYDCDSDNDDCQALTAQQLAEDIYQRARNRCTPLSETVGERNRSIKRRYQLVKSVQNTLTNLTKSSNITAQAAKRSFCNTLFKYSTSAGNSGRAEVVAVKAISPMVATCEQTIIAPPVVAYCK